MSGYGSEPVPPGANKPQPPSPGLGPYRLAQWSSRVGASLIDGLIIAAIFVVISIPLAVAFPFLSDSTGGIIGLVAGAFFGLLVFFVAMTLYAPILLVRWDGQTVGKRIAHIRVIQINGEKFDFIQAFVREGLVKGLLIALIALFTFLLLPLVNYLWPLWDDENRCLHDFLCSTRVVEA
jgi:uncharacterized RDD family membrane protein YckC